MADKILLIKVDPCCPCCYKKIKKILCKLQACENIKTITYDEKNYTVTLSGPFDPQNLSRKILCKACKLIIEIKVVDPPKPPPPPKTKTINQVCNDIEIIVKDKEDPKCTVTKKVIKECIPEKKEKKDGKEEKKTEIETINKVCNDIKIIVEDKCSDPPPPPPSPPCSPPKHCPKPPCPPPCPRPCPPPCPRPCPPPCEPPFKPPVCQVCCWTGCSVGYPGGSSCYSCGRIYGCVPDGPPMGCGGTSHGGYQLVSEHELSPSCTMM